MIAESSKSQESRISKIVLDNPLKSILIPIFLTFILGSGLRFIIVDDNMMAMLPTKMESKMTWDAVQNEFGSTESIFIAFGKEGKNIFNKEAFSQLWDVTRALEKIKEIEKVTSISNIPKILSNDGFLEIEDLQKNRELSKHTTEDIANYVNANSTIKNRMVSKHEDYFNIIIQPSPNVSHDILRHRVVQVGDSLLSMNYDIHYGGTAYITGSVPTMIKKDISTLIFIGLGLMCGILVLNIRNVFSVFLIFSIIIQSLIVMAGVMGWITYYTGSKYFYFTIINSSMPIILLTIANSDGVHFVTRFFKEMRSGKDTRQAISASIDKLLMPIFLTSITTISAFLALYFAPINQLLGYGVCLSIGILYAFILSVTFLPAAISFKKWNPESISISRESILEKTIRNIGVVIISNPVKILKTGLIIILFGFSGLMFVKVDVNIANFFKKGTEFRKSIDFIDEQMAGTMDFRVRVEGDVKDPGVLYEIEQLQKALKENPSINATYSIADAVKQMHFTLMDNNPEFNTIPKNGNKISNLLAMYSMSGDSDDLASIVDYNYNTSLITALSSVMSTDQIISFVDHIQSHVNNLEIIDRVSVTGMGVVIRDLIYLVIESSIISLVASLFGICFITSLFFKSMAWGMLSIIPLLSAIIINFGLMGFSGIYLSHVTALLSSVIIGVGVDFSIHYIYHFKANRTKDKSDKNSTETFNEVGYPIVLDSASNMSFGALIFSNFIPVQFVGGLMVFAMLATSVGTLTLLASLTEILKKKQIL